MKKKDVLKKTEIIYSRRFLYVILEHLNDDDYFYNKKINWEDWVIMRMDIKNALKISKEKVTSHKIIDLLFNILN